jgi:hypothetical protein
MAQLFACQGVWCAGLRNLKDQPVCTSVASGVHVRGGEGREDERTSSPRERYVPFPSLSFLPLSSFPVVPATGASSSDHANPLALSGDFGRLLADLFGRDDRLPACVGREGSPEVEAQAERRSPTFHHQINQRYQPAG